MKYERITDKEHRYKKCAGCTYKKCQYCDDKPDYEREGYNRLTELEDKIEQGTLIELPCKVRDKLYRVIKVFGKYQIQTLNVDVLHIEARNIWFINCSSERETLYSFSEKQIRVDIFLTREEAEKHLKELKNAR